MTQPEGNKSFEKRLGIFIIANAIVWGAVIIGCSLALKGTGYFDKLLPILSSGSIFSIILLPGGLLTKKKEK